MEDLQRIGGVNRGTASAIALAVGAIGLLAGCGSEPSRAVPAACRQGPAPVRRALLRAPGDVRIGGRRLSECFAPGGDAAGVEALGLSYLPAAQRLAAEARSNPRGPALLRLGFLIGSARRGAARGGVYAELLRRLEQELAGVDTASARFRSGERAARAHG